MKARLLRHLARTSTRVLLGLLAALAAAVVAALVYCVAMPGESFRGAAPPLTADQKRVADELRRHVTKLAIDIGPRRGDLGDSLRQAETYLHGELERAAATPGAKLRREPLRAAPGDAANLILDLPGKQPGPLVVIGAHYDTAPGDTRGANDNGSGTAAALILAQRLAHTSHALPIRIAFFANEEMPYFGGDLMGSLQHARACRARGEAIVAMLSLESIGYYSDEPGSQKYPAPLSRLYPDRGNFIGFVSNLSSRALLRAVVADFRSHATIPSEGAALPEALPGVGWSDHWSFWQLGYPAIMVTDTALFRDPTYHRTSDIASNLDYERLARVVVGLQGSIEQLAAKPR